MASESSSTGENPCGNGDLDEGEECDPGIDPSCPDTCLLCGDGVIGDGELCDPADDPRCDETCTELTLFAWAASASEDETQDAFEFPQWSGGEYSAGWRRMTPSGALASGPYFNTGTDTGVLETSDGWPEARLLSRSIAFPELSGSDEVVITVEHDYRFDWDDVANPQRYFDHGRVDLVDAMSTPATGLNVFPGTRSTPGLSCVDFDPNDVCFQPGVAPPGFCDGREEPLGLTGQSKNPLAMRSVETADVAGQTLRLSFRVLYDCANFDSIEPIAEDDAWKVSSVSVVVRRSMP